MCCTESELDEAFPIPFGVNLYGDCILGDSETEVVELCEGLRGGRGGAVNVFCKQSSEST